MKAVKVILLAVTVSSLLMSCGTSSDKMRMKIETAEQDLYHDSLRLPSREKADSVIAMYLDYATRFPKDTLAPNFLFRAGDLANSVKEFPHAIAFLGMITEKYPDYHKAPLALFLQGFIAENNMGDLKAAKGYYEAFLKKYPNHKLAQHAQASLDNLGKSPDELIKSFEEKAHKDSLSLNK